MQAAPPARAYHSQLRDAQAHQTRRRVLAAATRVFLDGGYGGATLRAVADEAGVSLAMIELLFGSKANLLKAAIDVAIAGDDEPVAMLDRAWAASAQAATTAAEFLNVMAVAVANSQSRSAGLVLAVFEGAARDPKLAQLRMQMIAQRTVMATWIVERLARLAPLRIDCRQQEAIDTVWLLMDPAVFERLTRHRQWSLDQYSTWLARSAARLLLKNGDKETKEAT